MSNNIDVSSLVAALTDVKVIEALTKALLPSIQAAVQSAVSSAMAESTARLDEQRELIDALGAENYELRRRIDAMEAYSRIDNVVVHGLSESFAEVGAGHRAADVATETSESSEDIFINFCQTKLNVNISKGDISVAHRLPKAQSANGPRPLLIRFANRRSRTRVMTARKELRVDRSCRIYINEHLTKEASYLFAEARKLVRAKTLAGAWSWNGRIYCKTLESRGSKSAPVDSLAALRKLAEN
jgi:hypothetical protein